MTDAEDFATLFAAHEARTTLEIGQVVKGRIIQITAEHVFVDVGGKGEAWIDRAELADDAGTLRVAVGDEVEATVVATGDEIRLSHKLRQGAQAREALAMAARSGLVVEGRVAGVIKGGYEVTIAGLRAFCPFSQMDVRRVDSEQEYVGRVLDFRVTRYEENGRNIVVSRRQILESQAAKAAEETRKKIAVDAVLPGTVAALADFGAFVDLGGVQGLVPMSELSHARVAKAGDRLRLGEAVTVKVIRIDEARGKITLSLKALEGDPWVAVAGRLRERQVVRGRAVRAAEFGVFVELLPGVDGLLHASEIPRHRHAELREAVAATAEIAVMIVTLDAGKRRIGLALAPEGAAVGEQMTSSVTLGAVLTGAVDRVEPFGVFVRLGPGQTGLVPNAELGTPRGADHRKMFPAGSEMKVMVLAIEEGGRRIRLSREKALAHEEQAETQAYLKDAGDKRGFGMTLGDALNQARKR
ncbi:MAG TPA: S1 RNA-binding domain-containing protein [Candidatus Binatia bacterium]|nr:S1 RNA-binding domain-containing protein [Candidatus Binatia bacterium]